MDMPETLQLTRKAYETELAILDFRLSRRDPAFHLGSGVSSVSGLLTWCSPLCSLVGSGPTPVGDPTSSPGVLGAGVRGFRAAGSWPDRIGTRPGTVRWVIRNPRDESSASQDRRSGRFGHGGRSDR